MFVVALVVIALGLGGRMLYIMIDRAFWRARSRATLARVGRGAPTSMSQDEAREIAWEMAEVQAHVMYTQAAADGTLGPIRLPLWKRIGGALLVGDLGWHAVRGIEHHLEHRG